MNERWISQLLRWPGYRPETSKQDVFCEARLCLGVVADEPRGIFWLGSQDSNLELMIQSHMCYHYTTSQHVEILRGYYTIKYGPCLKVA